jgi:hypothetical protein
MGGALLGASTYDPATPPSLPFFFLLLFTSPSNFFFGVSKKLEHIRFGNSFENDSNQPAPILLVDGTIKD